MRRHRTLPLIVALIALVAVASTVHAGGWATVAVVDTPESPVAGESTTMGLQVLQHDVTPVSWPAITVRAQGPGGQVVTADAVPVTGDEGRYTVALTMPAEGTWTVTFLSQDLVMEGSAILDIGPAAVIPPAATSQPIATTVDDGWARLLLAVLIGGLGVAVAIVLIRSRRTVATVGAVGER